MNSPNNHKLDKITEAEKNAKYFLAAIVESSQDSIITFDLNRVITTWNKAAEKLYGYSAEEVLGKSLELVMLPKDVVDLIEKIKNIADEIVVPIYETVRIHKDQNQADLQIALSPVRNSSGEVIGISTIARDITHAKIQENLKDEFISVASHELKTPVTSLKIFTEILLDKFQHATDPDLRLLVKLDQQVNKIIELIQNLLDTTKLTAGEIPLVMERFDMRELIRDQIEVIQPIAPRHQINYLVDERSQVVIADRKLIGQVIANLISNAVKYSPDSDTVIVSSKCTDYGIELSVQDFGIGIPAGLDNKVFERYFRVKTSNRSSISGVGLGLYVSAKIIHQHGGRIHVNSKEGIGSIFSFELPEHKK